MFRICVVLLFLSLSACLYGCMPATPQQQLPDNCRAAALPEQLLAANWLSQPGVWRLRQVTLLEAGGKKIPLEGLLRLDLVKKEARLVALNGMGLVMFDLLVTQEEQQ